MSLADLHVHSKYSGYPSDMLLKATGARESYTEVDFIYRSAKSRGMDFVTITDHNSLDGSLDLVRRYPQETFTGVELTVRFPEDGCCVHILCFDVTPSQFSVLNSLRPDIYAFRHYIRTNRIAYSVAHATFGVNGKLSLGVLEKLILLFDVFEGVNGSRNVVYNQIWTRVLTQLTPRDIDRIYKIHAIEPMSHDPWIKGLTGGSDDHAGLYIGKTFTRSDTDSRQGFLEALRCKKTISSGRSNHFSAMTYILGKIGSESCLASAEGIPGLWGRVSRMIFQQDRRLGWMDRFKLMTMRWSRKTGQRLIAGFITNVRNKKDSLMTDSPDELVEFYYDQLSDLSDKFLKSMVEDLQKAWSQNRFGDLFKSMSHVWTQLFLSAPFLGTWKLLNTNRRLVRELRQSFGYVLGAKEKKVLWFSDTIADLNGVSSTLRKIAEFSRQEAYQISMVVCEPEYQQTHNNVRNMIFLDSIGSFSSSLYPAYRMYFPSFLKAIKRIESEYPDEIVISTPGPVGLLGLLAARLCGIKATAIYHTDFSEQMKYVSSDSSVVNLFEYYLRWFYSCADEVRVPSREYLEILKDRGYSLPASGVFQRGIDRTLFYDDPAGARRFRERYGIEGAMLVYAGRVSEDKNISFLGNIYREVCKAHPETTLVVAGDGPGLETWRRSLSDLPRVIFLGGLQREQLREVYSAADMMVFPSVTDTFGMAVLEAQSCGLPCLVSDRGGPQSIVQDRITGYVLPSHNGRIWTQRISEILLRLKMDPGALAALRRQAVRMVQDRFDWNRALQDLIGDGHEHGIRKKCSSRLGTQDPEYSRE